MRVYDSEAMATRGPPTPDLEYADGVMGAARGADVVVLLTEWDQFRAIEPHRLRQEVSCATVPDGRHALDRQARRAAGWESRALGRP